MSIPPSISYDSEGSVKTLVLSPTLGFLHSFDSGFSIGLDFGVVLPIAPSEIEFSRNVSTAVPEQVENQYLAPIDAQVVDTLETIGRTPLPSVNLRIGWIPLEKARTILERARGVIRRHRSPAHRHPQRVRRSRLVEAQRRPFESPLLGMTLCPRTWSRPRNRFREEPPRSN